VKLLIDESLSSQVADQLAAAGHDAVHLEHLGLLGATDIDVMATARHAGRCLVSVDTDFGELLAIGRHSDPSVVLLRRAPHRPAEQAALILTAVQQLEADLLAGAIVVLTPGRARIRRLPV
jgi:predicted nuclease of predicted toxin-antitoxin system